MARSPAGACQRCLRRALCTFLQRGLWRAAAPLPVDAAHRARDGAASGDRDVHHRDRVSHRVGQPRYLRPNLSRHHRREPGRTAHPWPGGWAGPRPRAELHRQRRAPAASHHSSFGEATAVGGRYKGLPKTERVEMNQGIDVVGVYVRDQDEAVTFYVDKLGFRIHTDVKNGEYRWLTVQHPEQPTFQLGLFKPGPPVHDEVAARHRRQGRDAAAGAGRQGLSGGLRSPARKGRRVHAGTHRSLRHGGCRLSRPLRQWLENEPGTRVKDMAMKKSQSAAAGAPAKLIDAKIKELGDWRGATLGRIRALIREADPDVVESWKWDIPVWEHDGIICTGETYKTAVKTTFAKGASLEDPSKLFNS